MTKTFKQFLDNFVEMNGVKYSYSSVQINLDKGISHKIITWGEHHISENEIFNSPEDPSFGREDEIHITVLYGLHTTNVKEIKKLLEYVNPFEVTLGKVSMFANNDNFNVVKIDVSGRSLQNLHDYIKNNSKVTIKYPVFIPHITIAYVKKGSCKKLIGNEDFKGMTLKVNDLTFSSKDGTKTKISL